MYKRDLITAEIQQLAKALAQLMGLKTEGKQEEADQFFESVLEEEFGLSLEELLHFKEAEFEAYLRNKNFKPDVLDLFGKFLFARIDHFEQSAVADSVAEKLLLLYTFIENEHHISSFENLGRQRQIRQYLSS